MSFRSLTAPGPIQRLSPTALFSTALSPHGSLLCRSSRSPTASSRFVRSTASTPLTPRSSAARRAAPAARGTASRSSCAAPSSTPSRTTRPFRTYGVPDTTRDPLSAALAAPGPIQGQARVVCHPRFFTRPRDVRMYVFSADPTYHAARPAFQAPPRVFATLPFQS